MALTAAKPCTTSSSHFLQRSELLGDHILRKGNWNHLLAPFRRLAETRPQFEQTEGSIPPDLRQKLEGTTPGSIRPSAPEKRPRKCNVDSLPLLVRRLTWHQHWFLQHCITSHACRIHRPRTAHEDQRGAHQREGAWMARSPSILKTQTVPLGHARFRRPEKLACTGASHISGHP